VCIGKLKVATNKRGRADLIFTDDKRKLAVVIEAKFDKSIEVALS